MNAICFTCDNDCERKKRADDICICIYLVAVSHILISGWKKTLCNSGFGLIYSRKLIDILIEHHRTSSKDSFLYS